MTRSGVIRRDTDVITDAVSSYALLVVNKKIAELEAKVDYYEGVLKIISKIEGKDAHATSIEIAKMSIGDS